MNFMAMFEFGSNIALYLGMICVIAVLFFFIRRQVTETENKINNMMEVMTGLSIELANLKAFAIMNSRTGGGRENVSMEVDKLDEQMNISDEENEDGYQEDDEESDNDSSDEESDDDCEEVDEIEVIKVVEEETNKVEVEEIVPKTVKIDISSKLPANVTDYNKYNMKKLKDFCIDKGISAEYSKLKKADLVKLLQDFDAEQDEDEDEDEDEDDEEEELNLEEDSGTEEEINLEEENVIQADELEDLKLKDDEGQELEM
jgi:hypothetical protein